MEAAALLGSGHRFTQIVPQMLIDYLSSQYMPSFWFCDFC